MNKIVFSILLFFNTLLFAQKNCSSYIVSKVLGGKVTYYEPKSGTSFELKAGQTISLLKVEQLKFDPKNTKILLKSVCGGSVSLPKLVNVNGSPSIKLLTFYTNTDVAKVGTFTKEDEREAEYQYLQSFFTANGKKNNPNLFSIIGEEQAFKLMLKTFPLDEKHYFLISFKFNGNTTYKQLPIKSGSVIFNKDAIFRVQGKSIDATQVSNLELIYINKVTDEKTSICLLNLYFETDNNVIKLIQEN